MTARSWLSQVELLEPRGVQIAGDGEEGGAARPPSPSVPTRFTFLACVELCFGCVLEFDLASPLHTQASGEGSLKAGGTLQVGAQIRPDSGNVCYLHRPWSKQSTTRIVWTVC